MSKFTKLVNVENMIVEGYENSMTLRELADLHGVAPGTIRNLLVSRGVKMRDRGRRHKAK